MGEGKNKSSFHTWGTLNYFKHTTWKNLQQRTVNGANPRWEGNNSKYYLRKGVRIECSRQEFFDWCDERAAEILAIFSKGESPSVDRFPDATGHYKLGNMRILPDLVNRRLGSNKTKRPLLGTNIESGVTTRYESGQDAAARGGFNAGNICDCLKGRQKRHRGHTWQYLDL